MSSMIKVKTTTRHLLGSNVSHIHRSTDVVFHQWSQAGSRHPSPSISSLSLKPWSSLASPGLVVESGFHSSRTITIIGTVSQKAIKQRQGLQFVTWKSCTRGARGSSSKTAEAAGSAPKAGASLSTVDAAVDKPTRRQLWLLFWHSALPMIGFGLVDQTIMIRAGNAIDCTIGVLFGFSTLTAAAFGQLCSDASGVLFGGVIEGIAIYAGLQPTHLTSTQRALPIVKRVRLVGSLLGVVFGCCLGLLNLLFIDTSRSATLKKLEAYDDDDDDEEDDDKHELSVYENISRNVGTEKYKDEEAEKGTGIFPNTMLGLESDTGLAVSGIVVRTKKFLKQFRMEASNQHLFLQHKTATNESSVKQDAVPYGTLLKVWSYPKPSTLKTSENSKRSSMVVDGMLAAVSKALHDHGCSILQVHIGCSPVALDCTDKDNSEFPQVVSDDSPESSTATILEGAFYIVKRETYEPIWDSSELDELVRLLVVDTSSTLSLAAGPTAGGAILAADGDLGSGLNGSLPSSDGTTVTAKKLRKLVRRYTTAIGLSTSSKSTNSQFSQRKDPEKILDDRDNIDSKNSTRNDDNNFPNKTSTRDST